ncbi:MAG: hypothetical protein WCK98_06890 [bacterium]
MPELATNLKTDRRGEKNFLEAVFGRMRVCTPQKQKEYVVNDIRDNGGHKTLGHIPSGKRIRLSALSESLKDLLKLKKGARDVAKLLQEDFKQNLYSIIVQAKFDPGLSQDQTFNGEGQLPKFSVS